MHLSDYHQALRRAIWNIHGSDAVYLGTVPVKKTADGSVLWEGPVEVFDLVGHAKAKRSYAWGFPRDESGEPLNIFTVLELPPVDSPQAAVHIALDWSRPTERAPAQF